MPRTKLGEQFRPKPSVNYFRLFLKESEAIKKWTSADVGKAVGEHEATVRKKTNMPPEQWKVEDIFRYCKALDRDPADAFAAILKSS